MILPNLFPPFLHTFWHTRMAFFTWFHCPLTAAILAGFTTDRLVAQKRSKCGPKPIHLSLAKNGPIFPPCLYLPNSSQFFNGNNDMWQKVRRKNGSSGRGRQGATKGDDDPLIAGIYCFHRGAGFYPENGYIQSYVLLAVRRTKHTSSQSTRGLSRLRLTDWSERESESGDLGQNM